MTSERDLGELAAGVLARGHGAVDVLDVRADRLLGGISAGQVLSVVARFEDAGGRIRERSCVVKELLGPASWEAAVHGRLALEGVSLAPSLFGIIQDQARTLIVMERVIAAEGWPWRDTSTAELVLRVAAGLHAMRLTVDSRWDYDAELHRAAATTMDAVHAQGEGRIVDRVSSRAVRRLVEDLPALRRALASRGPFPPAVIHGDLHPGNVIVAADPEGSRPVFLDWGRARTGSPFEDVASWLHSLGCWEPEARRRHDTLLAAYLRARGHVGPIPAEVRELLWLAGGCNALAGALGHHLLAATAPTTPREDRARALCAVRDWLRIIRRAAAVWTAQAARGGLARRRSRGGRGRGPKPSGRSPHSPAGTRSTSRNSHHGSSRTPAR